MARNITKQKKITTDLNYLNKDFESFRRDLVKYAQVHFSDHIKDFSEASLGGVFVDMAAYVGDVMSYYLDHQFTKMIDTYEENKTHGLSQVVVGGSWGIR